MIVSLVRLDHAKVVYPSVLIEIQVIDHVPARVDDLLELANRTALGKSRSHGVQIQIEARIGIIVRYRKRSHGRHFGRRSRHLSRIDGLDRYHYRRRRYFSRDTGYPATRQTDSRKG